MYLSFRQPHNVLTDAYRKKMPAVSKYETVLEVERDTAAFFVAEGISRVLLLQPPAPASPTYREHSAALAYLVTSLLELQLGGADVLPSQIVGMVFNQSPTGPLQVEKIIRHITFVSSHGSSEEEVTYIVRIATE